MSSDPFATVLYSEDPAKAIRLMSGEQREAYSAYLDAVAVGHIRTLVGIITAAAFDHVPEEITPQGCVESIRSEQTRRRMLTTQKRIEMEPSDDLLREKMALAKARHIGRYSEEK